MGTDTVYYMHTPATYVHTNFAVESLSIRFNPEIESKICKKFAFGTVSSPFSYFQCLLSIFLHHLKIETEKKDKEKNFKLRNQKSPTFLQ